MNIQRLRNLTTGRLHTKMEDIYEDIEWFVGEQGMMTHQIPNAFQALQPILKRRPLEERFWDGQWDTDHVGEVELVPMNAEERKEFFKAYGELPSLLSSIGTKGES